jgi:hypothetical protein
MRWIFAGGIVFFSYEWYAHARGQPDALAIVIALNLGLAGLFVLLTEPARGEVSGVSRWAAQAAAEHDLGRKIVGVRWTNWRYLIPALIVIDLLVPIAATADAQSGLLLSLLSIPVFAIPAALWLRTVAIGAGRRVYVFDGGFIVARGRACTVYPFDEVVDTSVWMPGGPAKPRIRLRRGTGRWLVINQEVAIRAIMDKVPYERVSD